MSTIGLLAGAVKKIFSSVVEDIEGLFTDIAHLDASGEEQLNAFRERLPEEGGFKSFLSSIFSAAAKAADKIELNIGNSKLAVDSKGSIAKSGGASGLFSPTEVYAFVKTAFANPNLLENGVHLQILNDGGTSAKDPEKYTETDRKNLALCYVAAKSNGLHIINEAALLEDVLKDRPDLIAEAESTWSDFADVMEVTDNPHFKDAKEHLDELGQEASLAKMKSTLADPMKSEIVMKAFSGGMNPTSEDALKTAQQFELLLNDIGRLGTKGASPIAAAEIADLAPSPHDPEILQLIQGVRNNINKIEKEATSGKVFKANEIISEADIMSSMAQIQVLFDEAIAAAPDDEKREALEKLKSYAAHTAEININMLYAEPAPTEEPPVESETTHEEAPAATA